MTMLQANDVVRIRNLMDREWSAMYNSQTYRMSPGGECIAPYIAICNWFGHPEAVDIGPRERYRTDEYARLRVYYGIYDDEDKWEALTPKVEVYDLDGNRITTVIDDPSGSALTPAQSTVAERDLLVRQMAAMQKQMAMMQAQMDVKTREVAAEDSGDLIRDDDAPVNVNPHVLNPDDPRLTGKDAPIPSPEVSEDTPTKVRVSAP